MDPRMYPTGHTYNDAVKTVTPAGTDVLSAIRGSAEPVNYTIDSILQSLTDIKFDAGQEITDGGAVAITSGVNFVKLNKTTPKIEATIAAPTEGQLLIITQADAGTAGHTVTLTTGTYDGTATVATFNAAAETLVLFGISATRYVIVANIGAVGVV